MTIEPALEQSLNKSRVLLAKLAATAGIPDEAPESGGTLPEPSQVPLFYPDVFSWVTNYYTVMFVRRLRPSDRWCSRWFDHPEAMLRMEALWRTWEQSRLTETVGIAGWLRDQLDHHMPMLHDGDGPFAGCVAGEHRMPKPELYPVAEREPGHSLEATGQTVGSLR